MREKREKVGNKKREEQIYPKGVHIPTYMYVLYVHFSYLLCTHIMTAHRVTG